MSESVLGVELVTPEARVWSGQAKMVSARTVEGDLGILPGHEPLFGVLVDGKVSIKALDGAVSEFEVHGGFLSVSNNRVSILTESIS
ncbi:MAG TPA: F0F1 ATP synthase subunit epsilon [Candidatus Paceibacterota bacterium]|nr:F0F1 ATP synthase subunit epsilon [Candidatus Paceibacterota bacterium]